MIKQNEQPQLRRSLRVFDGVALLIGITIGSGIYATPYLIAGYFASFTGLILTWIVVGVFVMIGGLIADPGLFSIPGSWLTLDMAFDRFTWRVAGRRKAGNARPGGSATRPGVGISCPGRTV